MIILSIDPGTEQSALLYWDGKQIGFPKIIPNNEVLKVLADDILANDVHSVACEHVQSFGMAVGASVFGTCYWIGRFWQVTVQCQVNWIRVYRQQVKMHHCRSTRAKDSNIRQALVDRFGLPGKKSAPGLTYGIHDDLWSALAIATFVYDTHAKIEPVHV